MLFVDPTFLFIFLPTLLLVLWALRHFQYFKMLLPTLLLASIVFYGAWSYTYLAMLLAVIGCNYLITKYLFESNRNVVRRLFLVMGLVSHLGLLAYFKYTGFIADMLNINNSIEIILPLAISFYTFQQISFLVDVYNREQHAVPLINYFTYILFFPQLIAGPIVQYPQVGDQLNSFNKGNAKPDYFLGIAYLLIGLFKKWFIADPLAPLANTAFLFAELDGMIEPLFAWMGLMAFTFQLYFDFSAYGDMAIGIGLLMGIKLPINFDSPYKAHNISLFWRKWHITLGAFLRQYLFFPLGGSKVSQIITIRNLVIVMILGGIWHGAGLGFALWGLLHGLALAVHVIHKRLIGSKEFMVLKPFYVLLTFTFVTLTWVPFKAITLENTFAMYSSLFSISSSTIPEQFGLLKSEYGMGSVVTQTLILVFVPILVWGCNNSHHYARTFKKLYLKLIPLFSIKWIQVPAGLASGVGIMLCVKWMAGMPVESFLYFQF